MGPCNSVKSKRNMRTSPTVEQRDSTYSYSRSEKTLNPHLIISNLKDQVVIKHINDINGDVVKIDNCVDSTMIIMDTSMQVIVYRCQNCNIYIAPCKGCVILKESSNLRINSASRQFRCIDVNNCKASVYCNNEPEFERVKNFSIGCFFFMYTELPDLFYKSDLSVWDNIWSEIVDLTPTKKEIIGSQDNIIHENHGNQGIQEKEKPTCGQPLPNPPNPTQTQVTPSTAYLSNITYFNAREDPDFTLPFSIALKDQEISVDQYFPVPMTLGLSCGLYSLTQNRQSNKSCTNTNTNTLPISVASTNYLLFLFREQNVDTTKLYELLNDETLSSMSTFLIRSRFFESKNSDILKQIKNSLTIPSKAIKDFFEIDNFSQTGKFSCNSVVIKPCSTVFSPLDVFVMLWLVNDTDNFAEFLEITQNEFENCLCLKEDDFITPGYEGSAQAENSQLMKKS